MPWWVWLVGVILAVSATPQSNYDQQAVSINSLGSGIPELATLNGTVTELDTLAPTISLNRTKASLNCSTGFMNIKLSFQQDFYGIVYADYDRNSACRVSGNGEAETVLEIPLKGCGTIQDPLRVFTNNIVVRFHPGLEIEGDEVITVICRYPPPIVQPALIPEPLQLPLTPVAALAPLREFEILLIICAIVFLALLLLGIGCSYYCLKKRNIRVIRRRPVSTIGSEVTRISDPPSMFEGLKIPRAHAMDTSGSEEMTESVHTDYGSDVTSIATVEDFQSAYSDLGGEIDENIVYPDLHEPPIPAFDIKMRMKRFAKSLTPISSRASSVTEEMLAAQEQYLTTILERTETNTMETLERVRKSKADLGPPPVHARLRVQHKAPSVNGRDSDSETSQYSHDQLGTDMDLTEDELAPVVVDRSMRTALIESDHLQSARLVESVQVRESEFVTRREEEIRKRMAAHKQNTGFDVTVRTIEGRDNPMFSDDDTASMSEYMSQGPIEPVLIDRRGYSLHQDVSQMSSQFAHTSISNRQQVSKFDVLIRVLDAPPPGASGAGSDKDDLTSVFSEDDKQRWRDIVTYDTEFRTMLEAAQTTEEVTHAVSQIRYVSKYEKLFAPHKWDVIVRVLKAPSSITGKSISSRSTKSNRTSKTGTEYDLRSLAETTVDFGARRSDFESGSSVSGRSGQMSQYTAGGR
ncbi:uncharacterized protein LOC111701405 [Eurytemora carolleeae]|uniref:uncharacterized protein LOC111701405 n=1 Tax=Eurytemora carolleeae TaxID=1294199 RepID=UPI000C78E0A9|nr:uncharacterized protein LOC111701405 [Eurytemora carolleeae]|eukprot:XP_023328455.1 uncharacterized protein LOC111701405 [Eurytemora affinis]